MLGVTCVLWGHTLGMTAALESTSCGSPQALDVLGPAGMRGRPGFLDTVAFFRAV